MTNNQGASAYPRGTYIAQDPAGWTYLGTRTELDARINAYLATHPDVTSRADAEHAIRTTDRHRAEHFLTTIKRTHPAAFLGGGHDSAEPTRAIPLCTACGAHALLDAQSVTRGVCPWCWPTTNGNHPQRNGNTDTA